MDNYSALGPTAAENVLLSGVHGPIHPNRSYVGL